MKYSFEIPDDCVNWTIWSGCQPFSITPDSTGCVARLRFVGPDCKVFEDTVCCTEPAEIQPAIDECVGRIRRAMAGCA